MAVAEQQTERTDRALPSPAYLTSVIALALGVVLAVGVSALFGLVGWGGELASQTAGAVSGAAPLIIDGVRQRRAQRSQPRPRGQFREVFYRPKLYIASAFGFAVLLLDSAAGLFVWRLTRNLIRLAEGNQGQFMDVYTVLGAVITLPVVVVGTYLLAIAAGHRLGGHNRRWVLLGMGIYAAVRIAMVLASPPSPDMNISLSLIIAGIIITVPMMTGIALLGARRARKTQAAYYAKVYFRRLPPADQEATLALLDEAVAARKL